jgi:hypothetical protein
MSLSNSSTGSTYTCNGATVNFAIPFQYQLVTEIKVYLIEIATGIATLQTVTTHYTFTPNPTTPTGITMLVAPSALYKLRITRSTALSQLLDLINNSAFPADDAEEALDKIVQMVQEVNAQYGLALKIPMADIGVADTNLPTLVGKAGNTIVVKATEDGFEFGLGTAGIEEALIEAQAAVVDAEAAAATATAQAAIAEAAAIALAGALPVITGSMGAPVAIVGAAGIVFAGVVIDNTVFIQGSGGPVTITSNPKITAGTIVGQRILLIGCSDANTITMADGDGVNLNGSIVFQQYTCLLVVWDGANWVEVSRR